MRTASQHAEYGTWMHSLFLKHGYVATRGYVHATAPPLLVGEDDSIDIDLNDLPASLLVDIHGMLCGATLHRDRLTSDEMQHVFDALTVSDGTEFESILPRHGYVHSVCARLDGADGREPLFADVHGNIVCELEDLPAAMLDDMYDRLVQHPRDERRAFRERTDEGPQPMLSCDLSHECLSSVAALFESKTSRATYAYKDKKHLDRCDLFTRLLRDHGFRALPEDPDVWRDVRNRGLANVSCRDIHLRALPPEMQRDMYNIMVFAPKRACFEARQRRETQLAHEALERVKRRRAEGAW